MERTHDSDRVYRLFACAWFAISDHAAASTKVIITSVKGQMLGVHTVKTERLIEGFGF